MERSILKLSRKQVERLLAEKAVSVPLEDGSTVQVELTPDIAAPVVRTSDTFALQEKVEIFGALFVGRSDVYATRWESKTGKSGYSPVCVNQWRPGICQFPKVKCAECVHRSYAALTDQVLESHLRGDKTVGLYSLLPDSSCCFLAIDCDGAQWSADSLALLKTIHELGLASYDRMLPNQDWMPDGGFGNLIALPLQRVPRDKGNSVFIDEQDIPIADQWKYLVEIKKVSQDEVFSRIRDNAPSGNPFGIESVSIDDNVEDSWSHVREEGRGLSPSIPASTAPTYSGTVALRLDGEVSVRLHDENGQPLASFLKNQLIRLAAFQNPEFYQAQRLRLNTYHIPRVIGCAVEEAEWLKLPRGLGADVYACLKETGLKIEVFDERNDGTFIDVHFSGVLRDDQKTVVETALAHKTGIICAPTGFGKTVLACAILAERKVNTLVLVHRGQLLDQWRAQLQALLGVSKNDIGIFGKGKKKPTGRIDVATIQSLYRGQEVDPMIGEYGQIIVDECHHVSAFSFEQVLRAAPARYVLGLTATPIRRDGLHPIMFMQCGPLRVKIRRNKSDLGYRQEVVWKEVSSAAINTGMKMTDLYTELTQDSIRTSVIVDDIMSSLKEGRFPLVLTERKFHLDLIQKELASRSMVGIAVLYGGQGKKARAKAMAMIESKEAGSRVVLATGKLIGEGFDLPALDTLILALPISWRGTLQQYVGRLSREAAGKILVRVYDYQDQGHPILLRMAEKRRAGYKALGFETAEIKNISSSV